MKLTIAVRKTAAPQKIETADGVVVVQPGDIITYYGDASHVGLYVGDGMMVHASTYGIPVAVVPVNNAPIYNVRRY